VTKKHKKGFISLQIKVKVFRCTKCGVRNNNPLKHRCRRRPQSGAKR
jgi:hypothetical protein